MSNKIIPIKVKPSSIYLPHESDPANLRFTWAYEIIIHNESDEIVQLLQRLWRITDMTSRIEEVEGPGVVGLQPLIRPNKPFVYKSFCQLTTPQGTMEGYYEMQKLDEERFTVTIPKFALCAPAHITGPYRSKLH